MKDHKIGIVLFALFFAIMSVIPIKAMAGTVGDKITDNPTGSSLVDGGAGYGIDKAGDYIIEKGMPKGAPVPDLPIGRQSVGVIGSAGKIIKYAGVLISAVDNAKDAVNYITYKSPHKSGWEKGVDNGLYIAGTGMGLLATAGSIFAIFNPVTATSVGIAGTAYVTTHVGFAVVTTAIAAGRGAYNSQTFANVTDVLKGNKQIKIPIFDHSNQKDDLAAVKEDLGFDLYGWTGKEIPAANSIGISVKKPNIYIYSDIDQTVGVKLTPEEYITKSDPIYPAGSGWEAQVKNGSINGTGDFLFYEAQVPDQDFQKEKGWLVQGNNMKKDMEDILNKIGFNEREKMDFIEYWSSELSVNQNYVFYYEDNSIVDKIMPITISPSTENIYRIWFYIEKFDDSKKVINPEVKPIERGSYTVVEWGGMVK